MCPAPQSPTGDVLDEGLARDSAPDAARATMLIDPRAGLLLDANPAGWSVWGLDPATAAPPMAIDAAMPALQRLRELAGAPDLRTGGPVSLALWTARGLVQLACRVEPQSAPASRSGLLVTALHAVPSAAAGLGAKPAGVQSPSAGPMSGPEAGTASSLSRRERGVDLDVALDAWLAHELRTPLSAVIAYAEILKSEHFGPIANPRYKSYAADIYNSARHALGVVDSMLQGDRARTALPALSFADLDPAAVVEGCLTVVRPLAERASLELVAEVPAHLPRIVADELALRQMLLNLLSNAVKFARAGDRVTVRVAYTCNGPLTISVDDTGPGICPATADAPKAERAGLGLGLPLTRALAAANGARLAVESRPGRGTSVTISFGKDRVVPV